MISGALILRGQDVKAVIEVAPDWESVRPVQLRRESADFLGARWKYLLVLVARSVFKEKKTIKHRRL